MKVARIPPATARVLREFPSGRGLLGCVACKRRLGLPHPPHQHDWNREPGSVECQHHRKVVGGCAPDSFFKADDEHVGHHHAAPNKAPVADPIFAFDERVGCYGVERDEEELVDPDGGAPPRFARHQRWVEVAAVPMNEIDERRGWPKRILKVVRVIDDQLLDVDDGADEEEVQQKEPDEEIVEFAFADGDDDAIHARA